MFCHILNQWTVNNIKQIPDFVLFVFRTTLQQAKIEEEQKKWKPSSGGPSTSDDSRRPRIKKSTYFSDEEELSD